MRICIFVANRNTVCYCLCMLLAKVKSLMKDAHVQINKDDAAGESVRTGTLRAGSTGAMLPSGEILAAQCGRLAQARFLGQQQAPTTEMRAMFNGGFALEDYLEKQFKASGIEYRRETPVQLELSKGIVVNGRPDFDIKVGDEWVGVEVKSLASPFSVIKQVKNGFPFMKHLLQAATYAMVLGRDKWLIAIGNSFYARDKGLSIEPGLRWYQLNRVGGEFSCVNEKGSDIKLPFSERDIVAYYEAIRSGVEFRQLVERPHEKELKVDTYNRCNYCHMSSQCNLYDAKQIDFETWISRVPLNKENIGE